MIPLPFDEVIEPDPVIEVYKRDVDRTLLRQHLCLSVEERIQHFMALQRFAAELHEAGRRARERAGPPA